MKLYSTAAIKLYGSIDQEKHGTQYNPPNITKISSVISSCEGINTIHMIAIPPWQLT